jgi:hypothetical protein
MRMRMRMRAQWWRMALVEDVCEREMDVEGNSSR